MIFWKNYINTFWFINSLQIICNCYSLDVLIQNAVNRDLKFYYETSFMSELFKKVDLSESLLPDFFEKTGRAYSNIHNFMLDRINEFKGKVQIIDGTLKSYNSDEVNFFSMIKKRQG